MRKSIGRYLFCLLFVFLLGSSPLTWAKEKITVFAAASLTNALQDIAAEYQQQHDIQLVLSFGSSSTLAQQIVYGAPADIFMSADLKWMDYLQEKSLIDPHYKDILLTNSLVLITAADSLFAGKHIELIKDKKTDWMTLLADSKLALGDPDHVPAGIYAKQALTYLGDYDKLSPLMARANNVRNALLLVARKEAVLGIVYDTDARISEEVTVIGRFPVQSHVPIEYPIAINKDHVRKEVIDFYTHLKGEQAKRWFEKYGFERKK